MIQNILIYDGWQDAVKTAITNSGKSPTEVAVALWPHMKMNSAYARLSNALRPDKDDKLEFGEIIFICNFCKQFDPLYFMAQECSHARPEPRTPEDERVALMTKFNEGLAEMKVIAQRLERLKEKL